MQRENVTLYYNTAKRQKWGGDAYKENVTSEQHTHTCRKDKETDKAASTGGEDKDPERCLRIGA